MDAWLRTVKPGSSVRSQKSSISSSVRAAPYTKPTPKGSTSQSQTKARAPVVEEGNDEPELVTEEEIYYGYKNKPSSGQARFRGIDASSMSVAQLNKHILKTLGDSDNPITHSDIRDRSSLICSPATGHQRSEERYNRSLYLHDRSRKLKEQLSATNSTAVLGGVSIWIDGYLEDTTDIEMKEVVKAAGGEIKHSISGATHILTSQQLSGSKTHKLLHGKTRLNVQVVRPEWVWDSIEAGKKLSTRTYRIVTSTSRPIHDVLGGKPTPTPRPLWNDDSHV